MVLKSSNTVSFLEFFADISKAVVAIYASESSRFALLENGVHYYAMI